MNITIPTYSRMDDRYLRQLTDTLKQIQAALAKLPIVNVSASMHFDDAAASATPIGTAGTFVKATNPSTLDSPHNMSQPRYNRLECREKSELHIVASISFICAANNQTIGFAIAINDKVYVPSIIQSRITTGADNQAVTINAHVSVADGDYVEIWLTNYTTTGSVTIKHGHVTVLGHREEL